MKRVLVVVMFVAPLALMPATSPQSAPGAPLACAGLFFSEYVEGSSYNKALEIFNGTGSVVDLRADNYIVEIYFNGNTNPRTTINLTGTVADSGVYVLADDKANAVILAQADQTSAKNFFNGDDAVVLKQNGTIIDVIGQIGVDPGSEWGSGLISTRDNTLRRKSTVSSGDSNGGDAFDPWVEWKGYAQDAFDGLGTHTADCAIGDTAPSVFSTTPADGTTGVAVDVNITINFSEDVTVDPDWYDITCTLSGTHMATVSGDPQSFTLDPEDDFTTGDVCTVTVYAGQVADQDTDDPPDNMTTDYIWSFHVVGACSTIPLIQGGGAVSPCEDVTVSDVQGCVTGVAASGFYFQDLAGDGHSETSDGLFVYRGGDWSNPEGLAVGDLVSVSGQIIEFYNITEFEYPNAVSGIGSCTPPTPVLVPPISDPNLTLDAQYERYEAMRVSMSFDGWVVGATKRFRSRFPNGEPEIAFVDYNNSIPADSRVFEGDYPGYQGINYLSGGLDVDLPDLDFGDRVAGAGITGVLAYNYGKFQLLLDPGQTLTTEDRPDVTAAEPPLNPANAEFDVCFFNVENLFDNLNDGQGDWGDWAPGWPTSGSPEGAARYQAMLAARAEVIVNDLQSCTLIGVEEVEGKQQVYDDLAAAISALDPAQAWTAAFVPSGDARNITQGFLWRDDVALIGGVTPVSGAPYTGWVADGVLDFQRTVPTGLFRFQDGTPDQVDVRVYAVHFKSKRYASSCTTPDCTDLREREAADLRDILAHQQAVGEYTIGGGDLNDTLGSSPIDIMDASPASVNLFYDLPARERWTYVFNGGSQVLDYLYLTTNLLPPGSGWEHGFSAVHVNADFPTSERASDHDPVRVRFGRAPLCVIGDYDVNDDAVVDVVDVQQVAVDFGRDTYAEDDGAQTRHDVNCSGAVDVLDIVAMAGAWHRVGQ